eukprot:scaffold4233_cov153-Pinguiococcus_pyrenoidosus.AAC.6
MSKSKSQSKASAGRKSQASTLDRFFRATQESSSACDEMSGLHAELRCYILTSVKEQTALV